MRIKHFAGYGTVQAKKTKKKEDNARNVLLEISVTGNHECGLTRPFNDPYCIYQWLVRKFDKREIDLQSINYDCIDYYIQENGIDVEKAIYTITYKLV